MKGMKLRAPEKDYYVETLKALGANPTPMDMGEVYSCHADRRCGRSGEPHWTIVSYGFQNVNKYLVMSNHIIKPAFVMINEEFFQGLSEEYQQLIIDGCAKARDYANDYMETAMGRICRDCHRRRHDRVRARSDRVEGSHSERARRPGHQDLGCGRLRGSQGHRRSGLIILKKQTPRWKRFQSNHRYQKQDRVVCTDHPIFERSFP